LFLSQETEVQAQALEEYIDAHPKSPWVPGLRINLGKYYRNQGRYTKTLAQWEAAWWETLGYDDGWGKHVADYAWAHSTRLLACLGRREALEVMYQEVNGRLFEPGALTQIPAKYLKVRRIMGTHTGMNIVAC
jgi:hypothetical protein